MKLDIAAIKARADKATAGPFAIFYIEAEGFWQVKAQPHSAMRGMTREIAAFEDKNDAGFFTTAITDIPALIAALEASEAARVKAEQERDGYRSKLMQLADATEVSGMSWSGFNVLGDKKSIKAVQSAVHYAGQIEEYRAAFLQRKSELEQERDALKDALTNSCDLLESYIDTFGDMSGANRADLNDYRAVLSLADERGL